MRQQWSRRAFLGNAGAAGLVAAGVAAQVAVSFSAACSSKRPLPGTPGGGAVTIKHVFGETVISVPPKRVVSAGYTEQDDLLAVGVVPVAVTNWFGDQQFAVWPWAHPKLGDAQPVVLNLDNGIQVDKIAALKPDLIVAINAGVDDETYKKLSAIAPTVPQSDGEAFFEPWKLQAATIGQAVFQADQMGSVIAGVDAKFTSAGEQNPQFHDKKVLLLQGQLYQDNVLATMPGWRTEFLTKMGLVVADNLTPFAVDHRAFIPRKDIKAVLDAADVLIWTTESQEEQKALLADPDVAPSQAHAVFTTKEQAGAIAFASPLSYPLVADQLPLMITKVLR